MIEKSLEQAAKIIRDPDVAPTVRLGIVFGADALPEVAMDEIRKARAVTPNPLDPPEPVQGR